MLGDRRNAAYIVLLGSLTIFYFVAGKFGLEMALVHTNVSPIWPPSGIALALFLLLGRRIWPAIFIGAFLVNFTTAGSIFLSLAIAGGNTLEGFVGAYLIKRYASGLKVFNSPGDIFRFVSIIALSTGIAATVGGFSLALSGSAAWMQFPEIFLTWWLGDIGGVLLITPLILIWVANRKFIFEKEKALELLAFSAVLIFVSLAVFTGFPFQALDNYPIAFLIFPALIWAAFRFDQRETITASFVTSAIALWGTLNGHGPFIVGAPNESLLMMQAFAGTITMLSLSTAAIFYERREERDKATKILNDHVVELEKALGTIQHHAMHDDLTGLPNRKALDERFILAKSMAVRHNKKMALLFIDLDRFKNINDTFGHNIGDKILKDSAEKLSAAVREIDIVSRLGGDEFIVVLNDIETTGDVEKVANIILDTLNRGISIENNFVYTTASIGVSVFSEDGEDIDSLLKSADVALYRAKDSGRNCYRMYDQEMKSKLHAKLFLEEDLKRAIEKQQLQIVFQPYLDLETNEVKGVEALVRWNHPKFGMISPYNFIPIAEESGLIIPIGDWILENAIKEVCSWKKEGIDLPVSINLSAKQFSVTNLAKKISELIKKYGLDPQFLEFEITETIAMHNKENTLLKLKELKEIGLSITMDDFGTGYSSLANLKDFASDKLKIDQSFVKNVVGNKQDTAIIGTIISMGHTLEQKVCAEGIENEEQRVLLKSMGCDLGQGFYFCRPIKGGDFLKWIKRRGKPSELLSV